MSKVDNFSILQGDEYVFEYWNDPELVYDIEDLVSEAVLSSRMFTWTSSFLYKVMVF